MTIGVVKPRKRTLNASPNLRRQDSRKEIGRSSQRVVCSAGGAEGPGGSALMPVAWQDLVGIPMPCRALGQGCLLMAATALLAIAEAPTSGAASRAQASAKSAANAAQARRGPRGRRGLRGLRGLSGP